MHLCRNGPGPRPGPKYLSPPPGEAQQGRPIGVPSTRGDPSGLAPSVLARLTIHLEVISKYIL